MPAAPRRSRPPYPQAFAGGVGAVAQQEAANLLFIVFKPMLLAYTWAPWGGGTEAAARLLRCASNNSEFEPIFVGFLLAVSQLVAGDDAVLKFLTMVCLFGRCGHTLFFITWPITGSVPRTMCFDCFFFGALIMGIYAAATLV